MVRDRKCLPQLSWLSTISTMADMPIMAQVRFYELLEIPHLGLSISRSLRQAMLSTIIHAQFSPHPLAFSAPCSSAFLCERHCILPGGLLIQDPFQESIFGPWNIYTFAPSLVGVQFHYSSLFSICSQDQDIMFKIFTGGSQIQHPVLPNLLETQVQLSR